ncbi:MAG: VWA domain-containing protein [Deltaproteobacteria bacterium]|nr:VWA domain-containing protein [Deltaproteobacteria bacterium]
MNRTIGIFSAALALFVTAFFVQARYFQAAEKVALPQPAPIEAPQEPAAPPPIVQLAILLDTSSSMDGLIDQARTRLWRVVNELAELKRAGRTPELRVALYEYGNDGLEAATGYLRQVQAFTTDLDDVSQGLFALTTNGGSEHCGQVIDAALKGLAWDPDPGTLKLIFIAGNEGFDQGPVDYQQALADARQRGVKVNTVHCGPEASGIAGHWRDGALLAGGRFHSIDQNQALTWIAAPQDEEIARLGAQINETTIAFGAHGSAGLANVAAQDLNALSTGRGANIQRAMTKGTKVYDNSKWDLVSAIQKKKAKIRQLDKQLLDARYAGLSDEELKVEVEKLQQRRDTLTARLGKLKKEREGWVASERQKQAQQEGQSFDDSLVDSIRNQAAAGGFEVEGSQVAAPGES